MEKLIVFLLLSSMLIQPFTAQCPGLKVTWPELVGVPAKFARETIQKENSRLTIVPSILSGSPVTADFSCNRVRLFVNVLDIVVQVPRIG
ncbi:trypsin inhibitor 1-like [Solanum verrucosum]|uniref:trypsin inhibitor 1-like n=1 Tax=Solanum verrucosum TaxID=315347 RepID=UPI0020D06BB5|nr:trypsin inhibitor 1-like [Solanum verrucosum]